MFYPPTTEIADMLYRPDYRSVNNKFLARFKEARNYQKPNWCVQAQSVLELKICSNSKLSELDIELTTLYRNFRSDKKGKAKVIATSSYQNRVKCASNIECIKSNYIAVIADLTALSRVDIVPITCAFKNTSGSVTNVQNFTNLRQEAYLQSKIIDRVPLGASVKIRQPGTYWRPDKCTATCNGTNQNAIKQCIDNNDVWIEVDYNGRRGFLSRKFLE